MNTIRLFVALAMFVAGLTEAYAQNPPFNPFHYKFDGPDRLLTNEFATRNPKAPGVKLDKNWTMSSGSLFVHNQMGYTGPSYARVPSGEDVGPNSATFTNSAFFRCQTRRSDFGDVAVQLIIKPIGFFVPTPTVAENADGVHVYLRYRMYRNGASESFEFYDFSIARSDGKVVIAKKFRNGVLERTLVSENYMISMRSEHQVKVAVANQGPRNVVLELWIDGERRLQAIDTSPDGEATNRTPGQIDIVGTNCEFYFNSVNADPWQDQDRQPPGPQPMTDRQRTAMAFARLNDAAARLSDSVPPDDPDYPKIRELQPAINLIQSAIPESGIVNTCITDEILEIARKFNRRVDKNDKVAFADGHKQIIKMSKSDDPFGVAKVTVVAKDSSGNILKGWDIRYTIDDWDHGDVKNDWWGDFEGVTIAAKELRKGNFYTYRVENKDKLLSSKKRPGTPLKDDVEIEITVSGAMATKPSEKHKTNASKSGQPKSKKR